MPRFLSAIKLKARHKDVKQLRVCIADKGVSIHLMYKQPEKEGVSFIVIGLNNGWKQNKDMGKKTNQNFLSIPHTMLINMIKYKAAILGIKVKTVQEK